MAIVLAVGVGALLFRHNVVRLHLMAGKVELEVEIAG